MRILINCSNLKLGGGLQVADSVCRCLKDISQHKYIVVLSAAMDSTAKALEEVSYVKVIRHDVKNDWRTLLLGRDVVMDRLVEEKKIEAVLTIFGPSRWIPQCKHVCGFARAQLLMQDSPYFNRLGLLQRLKEKVMLKLLEISFRKCANVFHTENPMISQMLEKKFKGCKVYTVTNYYNQVFDEPDKQIEHPLPEFDGVSLLSINTPYPHKNMGIAFEAAKLLKAQHPDFRFRFVMTAQKQDFNYDFLQDPDGIAKHFCLIGKVNVAECPSLYRQCDFCFQPTLMECFTATYCEAMRMDKPIISTNLQFAKGLCGIAAKYYEPVDGQSCADSIYSLANDKNLQDQYIKMGKKQLKQFDDYNERARKLIEITTRVV